MLFDELLLAIFVFQLISLGLSRFHKRHNKSGNGICTRTGMFAQIGASSTMPSESARPRRALQKDSIANRRLVA
jgi:hypothetical protein